MEVAWSRRNWGLPDAIVRDGLGHGTVDLEILFGPQQH